MPVPVRCSQPWCSDACCCSACDDATANGVALARSGQLQAAAVLLMLPATLPSLPCRRALPHAGWQLPCSQRGCQPADRRGPAAGLGGALRWAWQHGLCFILSCCNRRLHGNPNCLGIAPFPFPVPAVEEYVAKAVALTSDVRLLAQLRAGLRQRMLQVGAGWDGAEQCCVCLANCLQLRGLSGGRGSKSSAPHCADAAPLPAPACAVAPV